MGFLMVKLFIYFTKYINALINDSTNLGNYPTALTLTNWTTKNNKAPNFAFSRKIINPLNKTGCQLKAVSPYKLNANFNNS